MIEIKNRYTGKVIKTIDSYSLRDSDLSGSDLSNSDLRGSNLSGSNLRNSILRGSDLSGSNLRNSILRDSDLSDSDLSGSNLRDSNLRDSDLTCSDLSYSNLRDSNLRGSILRDSDLRGSDLRWCIGNGVEIKTIIGLKWHVSITIDVIAIGCEQHLSEEWMNFDDDKINRMDPYTLEFWKEWKDYIFKMHSTFD